MKEKKRPLAAASLVPVKIENAEISIIISLGIGLLILIVDKRQFRHIDELIKTQHELTSDKVELTMISNIDVLRLVFFEDSSGKFG